MEILSATILSAIIIGLALLWGFVICIAARQSRDAKYKWTPCSWCGWWFDTRGTRRKSAPLIMDYPLSHGMCPHCAEKWTRDLNAQLQDPAVKMDLNQAINQ